MMLDKETERKIVECARKIEAYLSCEMEMGVYPVATSFGIDREYGIVVTPEEEGRFVSIAQKEGGAEREYPLRGVLNIPSVFAAALLELVVDWKAIKGRLEDQVKKVEEFEKWLDAFEA